MDSRVVLDCTITCPDCGAKHSETMPVDTTVVLHECDACGHVFRPPPGACCIYCAYADAPCPSQQQENLIQGCDYGGCCIGTAG